VALAQELCGIVLPHAAHKKSALLEGLAVTRHCSRRVGSHKALFQKGWQSQGCGRVGTNTWTVHFHTPRVDEANEELSRCG
jgi:hypothetical protein